MFGIGFSELLLVGLVALLVLGPQRLPHAARTAGLWLGRLRRAFNNIRQEVEREIGADEIRRQLHNEAILDMERQFKQSFADSGKDSAAPSVAAALPPAPSAPSALTLEKPLEKPSAPEEKARPAHD